MLSRDEKERKTPDGCLEREPSEDIVPTLKPPDGGWGWVVVLASFIIHILADGVTYSFGVFIVEFIEFFDESRGKTSWIASILVGVTLGAGTKI